MDLSFNIFEIYCRYCDITSRMICTEGNVYSLDDELERLRISREALAQFWKEVELKIGARVSILEEVGKFMCSRKLELTADYSEFKRFYDFVFFICRENGQKNITVSRAVSAWRLVLEGRFRLLNQWCSFVEENQRHNISEDTWRQVLSFCRCVHENLQGYDPAGAWPVLIDDFVEYMYRTDRNPSTPNTFCNCGDSEPQKCLKNFPGSKRKWGQNMQMEEDSSDGCSNSSSTASSKRRQHYLGFTENDDFKHSSNSFGCNKSSPCAVERCLSRGFAGLLSGRSCLQFDHDARVSYT